MLAPSDHTFYIQVLYNVIVFIYLFFKVQLISLKNVRLSHII